MVKIMEKLREFIGSDVYENAIKKICQLTNINIYSVYNDVLLKLDNDKLEKAELDIEELTELLKSDYAKLINYVIAKLVKFHGVKEVQEYPEGEEPEDDAESNKSDQGYSKGFLLMYIIEYAIIRKKPDELDNYLKLNRIPHAKQYAKEIKDIYAKIQLL